MIRRKNNKKPKQPKAKVLILSWEDHAQYLMQVGGLTERSAIRIATKTYKQHWGFTPDEHQKEIEELWEHYPRTPYEKASWQ